MRGLALVALVAVLVLGCKDENDMPDNVTPGPGPTGSQPEQTTLSVAEWELAPGVSLSPDTHTFDIVLRETACSGGDSAKGRVDAMVETGADAIVVTVVVRVKPGMNSCQGNPLTPFTVELGVPLGTRTLLQGTEGEPIPLGIDRDG
jgi:hypothetical protein